MTTLISVHFIPEILMQRDSNDEKFGVFEAYCASKARILSPFSLYRGISLRNHPLNFLREGAPNALLIFQNSLKLHSPYTRRFQLRVENVQ